MANVKFEECFLRNTDDFISVDDLQKVYDKHDGTYEQYYLGNFYCPECFIAQLSFHPNAQTPHFRSNGKHNDKCSFNFDPVSKKQIEEYCNNQWNRDAINRKLKSCLDLLSMYKPQSMAGKIRVHNKKSEENLDYFTVEVKSKRRSIRRKKLTTSFSKDDYDMPMLFYGTVLLEWDLRNEDIKFLRIKNIDKGTYICSMSVSNNIYSHIQEDMKFDGRKKCNVAFLSSMERKDDKFNNCRIKYSTELVINEINIG